MGRLFLDRILSSIGAAGLSAAALGTLFLVSMSLPLARAQQFGLAPLLNPEGSRLFPQAVVYPRHPGKPDPRWQAFKWKYVDQEAEGAKYRLYFYEGEEWTARLVVPELRQEMRKLIETFKYVPEKQFSYLLFTSLREFQQANVFAITEGVQGVTSTTEATMAIPYWGEMDPFRHVSTHEMVHQFQVQKGNKVAGMNAALAFEGFPLWFIEGMAEYYSLGGVDPETRMFVRDILLHPDKERDYEVPEFFEYMHLDFVHVYKLGQVKIDFLETRFGPGTTQRIFEGGLSSLDAERLTFREYVASEFKMSPEDVEKAWKAYLHAGYMPEAGRLSQPMESLGELAEAGDTLDHFDVSPDGSMIAVREIDPLSGMTYIRILDLARGNEKIEVTHDFQPGVISLYFMQRPTLSISDRWIAYVVETTSGPELEVRGLRRRDGGELALGRPRRLELHRHELVQASAPAIEPDGDEIAFVGLGSNGWSNLYTVKLADVGRRARLRRVTEKYHGWRTPVWDPRTRALIAASDLSTGGKYSLFRIDPGNGPPEPLTASSMDELSPDAAGGAIAFQSWASGTSQIHLLTGVQQTRITEATTGLMQPKLRGDTLYALGFRGGRFRIFRIPRERWLNIPSDPPPGLVAERRKAHPWAANLADYPEAGVHSYKPFRSNGMRLDYVNALIGSGTVGIVQAGVSDLMRNYGAFAELALLGSWEFFSASAFLTSSKGRATWVAGAYRTVQTRLDDLFMEDDIVRLYLNKEFGVLGSIQHPTGPFSYVDFGLRAGGVTRSDFNDPELTSQWETFNPGLEFFAAPVVRVGYDRILYEVFTGPLKGYGALFEADTTFFPRREDVSERLRLDAAYYFQAAGRMVLAFQGLAGAAFGGRFKNPFLVSSDDILRAYPFGDDRLRGNYVLAGKAELRFPIGTFFGFPPLRGLLAYDLGSTFNHRDQPGKKASSSYTGGLSLNLPPLAINILLSYPMRTAPGPQLDAPPIVHFTLRYLYL